MNETEEYQSIAPSMEQLLSQRIASKTSEAQPKNGFDPYKIMVNKKNGVQEEKPLEVQRWPAEDIKRLEDFCKKHGIVGFNCGRLPPILALRLLKDKLGISDAVVDDKFIESYNINYPYTEAISKKQLIKG